MTVNHNGDTTKERVCVDCGDRSMIRAQSEMPKRCYPCATKHRWKISRQSFNNRVVYSAEERRARTVASRYKISLDEAIKLRAQELCDICGQREIRASGRGASYGEVKALSVDHDVMTGKIRGMLCGSCNMAIGILGHDPDRLRAAADYLERHR